MGAAARRARRAQRRSEGPALLADLAAIRGGAPYEPDRRCPCRWSCGYGTGPTSDHQRRGRGELAGRAARRRAATIDGAGHTAARRHPAEFAALRPAVTVAQRSRAPDTCSHVRSAPGEPVALGTARDRAALATGRGQRRARRALALAADERREAVAAVVAGYPRYVDAWAQLGGLGRDDDRALRLLPGRLPPRPRHACGQRLAGLRLRALGPRDEPWVPPRRRRPRQAAGRIGETDEQERCALFLRQLDPDVAPRRLRLITTATATLVVATVAAIVSWRYLFRSPTEPMVDLHVYERAGDAVRHGRERVRERRHAPAVHVPTVRRAAWRRSVAPFTGWTGQFLWTLATVAAAVGVVYLSFRALVDRCPAAWRPLALGALVAVALATHPFVEHVFYGQVNVFLVLLCLVDLLVVGGRRWQGALIGIATALKLTPGVFGIHLWLTGRRRAALVALASFVACTALAFVVVPSSSIDFWTREIYEGQRVAGSVTYTSNQSLLGLVARLVPDGFAAPVWLVAAGVLAIVGFVRARDAHAAGDVLGGIAITALLAVLLSPIAWIHHFVWFVPVLGALVADGRDRRRVRGARQRSRRCCCFVCRGGAGRCSTRGRCWPRSASSSTTRTRCWPSGSCWRTRSASASRPGPRCPRRPDRHRSPHPQFLRSCSDRRLSAALSAHRQPIRYRICERLTTALTVSVCVGNAVR